MFLLARAPSGPRWQRRSRAPFRRISLALSSRDFENRFDFDRDVARQRRGSHGSPRVPSRLAEYLDKKIGGAVDDFGMLRESRRGIDETGDLDHALDPVEVTVQRHGRLRNDIEAGKPRRAPRILEIDIRAHDTHIFKALSAQGDLAR